MVGSQQLDSVSAAAPAYADLNSVSTGQLVIADSLLSPLSEHVENSLTIRAMRNRD